jgi:dienelactone hydrolase
MVRNWPLEVLDFRFPVHQADSITVEGYFSYPENRHITSGILLLPDIIGHAFVNSQLVADQFAANGYLVVMPDQFHGDSIPLNRPPGLDLQKWLKGPPGHLPDRVDPIIDACLKVMRDLGCKKLGAAGYCFGAKYVVRYLQPGKIDAGFCAHPSFVDNKELETVKGPLSIAAALIDHHFPLDKRCESEEILGKTGQPFQINLFSNVQHGFALRGDIKQDVVKFAKEQAFLQALRWFNEYLRN